MPLPIENAMTKGRLVTIDALRGMAALSIAVAHVSGNIVMTFEQMGDSLLNILFFPFTVGIARVYLFFLISGFCIHLRWVKAKVDPNRDTKKALEFIPFWKRRFWRLYPPYLIALAIYIFLELILGKLVFDRFFLWDLFAHVFMIHNLDANTVYSFNGQFWTLAIEEQLYLAYFLLIWVRVKWGWKAAIGLTLLARVGWFAFTPLVFNLTGFKIPAVEASLGTWFLWAAGALAVEYAYGIVRLPKWTTNLGLGIVSLAACAAWYVYGFVALVDNPGVLSKVWWLTAQPMWGVTFFFLMNWFVSLENRTLGAAANRLLRVGAWFGIFSYSIYLMCEFVVRISPGTHWLLRAVLTVTIGYCFHRLFERPFMNESWKAGARRYESRNPALKEIEAV